MSIQLSQASMEKREQISGNIHKLFLHYLFPSVAATVMISINFFVDTLCVGQKLGEMGLAALNIAQPATGLLYGLGSLLGIGGSTLYSIHMGRGDVKKARSVYTVTFGTVLAISLLLMVLGLVFIGDIATFLGGTGNSRQGVLDYLFYVFLFAPVFSVEMFLTTFVRNDNAPRISMAATFCGSGLNIVLDILFVFGLNWGIGGASFASSISIMIACIVLISSTFRKKSGLKPLLTGIKFRALFESIRIGFPSFIQEITASVVLLTFNTVLLKISGETAVAVYGVIGNLSIIIGSAITGVANAMQPLVSTNVGAGKLLRIRKILQLALLYSFGMTFVIFLVGEIWPHFFINVFIQADAHFLEIAVPAIRIVFVSYLLTSINTLLAVYFQSAKASNEALAVTLSRGILLPIVCVTGCGFFLGIDGVWTSTIMAEVIALGIAYFLYRKVRNRLREQNYERLKYFNGKKAHETLDAILQQLGAEDLTSFSELIPVCNSRNEDVVSIPTFIGIEDRTVNYEGQYTPAYDDEDMGLLLAVGGLLFTDLYEQNDIYKRDKKMEESYPAAAPAMSALAEKCFRFTYNEDTEESSVISYFSTVWGNEAERVNENANEKL